jgi:simple sugar transport system permease protein
MSESRPEDAGASVEQATADETEQDNWSARFLRELRGGSALVTLLSIVLALVIGAILIAVADSETQEAAGYFFANPVDTISAAWGAISDAYAAMFRGSIINVSEYSIGRAIRPLGETLAQASPLIAAGLGIALAFRAGLFNIGAEGQIIIAAIFAGYVGFTWHLPPVVHLVVAVVAAMVGGALWAGIAGVLKARTGAHEVVVTIMLNWIAGFLILYLLTTQAFQRPGSSNPISPNLDADALFGRPFEGSRFHIGFFFVIAAAAFVAWLLNRSTLGFEFRAVGANPHAARTAGMSVGKAYILVMVIAGALAGLAGSMLTQGTERYLTAGISSNIGFDAITVALLGRANPWGTVAAGILFGALRAGGVTMQASTGTPIDIILVIQALIVLFIAAPPLIRSIFRVRVRAAGPVSGLAEGWRS